MELVSEKSHSVYTPGSVKMYRIFPKHFIHLKNQTKYFRKNYFESCFNYSKFNMCYVTLAISTSNTTVYNKTLLEITLLISEFRTKISELFKFKMILLYTVFPGIQNSRRAYANFVPFHSCSLYIFLFGHI